MDQALGTAEPPSGMAHAPSAAEAELARLYATLPVAMARFDHVLRIQRVNQRMADMLGLAAPLGRTLRELAPAAADLLEPRLRAALADAAPVHDLELPAADPAGSGFWRIDIIPQGGPATAPPDASDSAAPAAPAGAADGLVLLIRRVGARRAALLENEARFRRACAAAGIRTFEAGPSGQFVIPPESFRAYGLPPAASIDFPTFLSRLRPEDRATLSAEYARLAREGGSLHVEFQVPQADGTERWVDLRGEAVAGAAGVPRHIIGVNIDITARKRAEAALAEREAELQGTFESAAVGFALLGLDGRWKRVNARLCSMLGYSAAELLARNIAGVTHPADLGVSAELMRGLLAGELPSVSFEKRYLRRDGAVIWAEVHSAIQRDAAGRQLHLVTVVHDISARKTAESALADREALFRATFEQAAVGFALVSLDGRWIDVNRRICAMLGYTEAELLALSFQGLTPPEEREASMAMMRRVLRGERATESLEKHYITRDGRPLWVNVTTGLQRDAAGQPQHFITVVEDIDARKSAERALAEREAMLRATFDQAAMAVVVADFDGRWVRVNRRFCDMLGYTEDEAMATTFQQVTHPEDFGPMLACIHALVRGEAASFSSEKRCIRKDGGVIWTNLTISLQRDADGTPRNLIGVLEDITARRAAEAALTERQAMLALFIDRAPIGIAMFDTEMRYLACSARFIEDYELTGLTPADLVGRHHSEVFPEIPERWRELHRRALAGEMLRADEDQFPRADGRLDWVRWQLAPWRRADGAIGGVILLSENITARKQAEAVLTRDRTELEQLVTARTEELREAQMRLAQAEKLTALGQLAGGIAHDFNNVIQAVQGGAELLRRRAADPAAVQHLAGLIEDATRRAASVTHRLLAFARRGELHAAPVDPAALLDGMGELLRHTLGTAIAVELQAPPGLPPLLADRSQLETALVNLATNARDAMPHGGSLVLAAALEPAAATPELPPGRYIRLTMRDSGVGMAPDLLRRATEPFFTTKVAEKGTGLGLAMVKGFVEQSGGAFLLESAPGAGTRASLWLPLASGFPPPGDPAAPVPPARGAHILLVDDDAVVRELLGEQFAVAGHVVTVAADGAAALAVLDAGTRVDLLVSDLSMPGMDGIAMLRQARRRRPGLPCILLTGFASAAAALASAPQQDGFTLLHKPITEQALGEQVAKILAAASLEPALATC